MTVARALAAGLPSARRLAVAMIVCAATWAAAGAGSASAVIVQLPNGKTLSYQPLQGSETVQPFDRFFSNLDYNGGPVMPSNTNYAVYWAPEGSPGYPSGYQSGLDQYFEDLAHDSGGTANVDSVSAQYNDAAGEFARYESHFGGALVDTDPYPANGCTRAAICLTDAQLQAELKSFVKAQGLPIDLTHEYFLLTPPKVEDCFTSGGSECSAGTTRAVYCAYHGNIPVGGSELIYANDPYVTGIVGCDEKIHPNGPSDGALEGGLSHEHNESITDPEPNNAWTDFGGSGGEIGDKCSGSTGTSLGTAPNGAKYNQLINGDYYWYQEEWSNQTDQCLQRLSFSGEEPTATFTTTPEGGTAVHFDASGSTAPGGVFRYNWQFNDAGGGPSAPTETTSSTVNHTFPSTGSYTVALTVFASDGTSVGTARTVEVGTLSPPTVTKLSPTKGPAGGGTLVKITGTNLSGATAVHFGTASASGFVVESPTKILAEAPPGTPGTVEVTVTTPAGTSAASTADRYKYTPTVASVSPTSGPRTGGTTVTVTGSGFATAAGATTFKFGTTKGTGVSCTSSTTCTVVAPAHEAATVDVKAVVNKVASPKSAGDRFTFS